MMNKTINEIKITLEGINSRIPEAEEWISDLEDKIEEITTTEQKKQKKTKERADSRSKNYNSVACGRKTTFTERHTKRKGRGLCAR